MHRRLRTLAVAAVCALALIACGGNADTGDTSAVGGFPMTVENCGQQLTFNKPPERALLITRYSAPLLEAVGALDKVVAKVGEFPSEIYPEQTRTVLEKIPTIGSDVNSGQGVQVSLEAVLTQNPDTVIGYEPEGSGITKEALARSGIPFIASFVADCPNPAPLYQNPSFDAVYDQVEFYGRIFNRQDEAAAAVASLRGRVAKVQGAAAQGAAPRTAAALFVPLGGGQLYTYGTQSMVDAQMGTVGLKNVFGNVDDRDIDVSFEEVLGRNPDVLIILTSGDLQAGKDAFMSLQGVASLTAVRNDDVLVMKFDYMDPPTPPGGHLG